MLLSLVWLQQQQPQQQYAQGMPVMYQTMPQQQQQAAALQQQAVGLQQQHPVASTSDNSGSGSYHLLNQYGAPAQAANPGMPSPIQQRGQQQYILSPQVLPPMLIQQQQPGPGAVALGMQQQAQVGQDLSRGTAEGGMGGAMVHLSLQVTGSQFALVSNQLYNIAAMSGADLTSAPVAAGLFHINITGAQSQVTGARQLITSLLSQVL